MLFEFHYSVDFNFLSFGILGSLWNFETITGSLMKVSKGAKIRNRYNQVPHLTQDTNGKVTNSQLDTTNESQEVSPFPKWQKLASLTQDICIL